jgi:hypothetical protein
MISITITRGIFQKTILRKSMSQHMSILPIAAQMETNSEREVGVLGAVGIHIGQQVIRNAISWLTSFAIKVRNAKDVHVATVQIASPTCIRLTLLDSCSWNSEDASKEAQEGYEWSFHIEVWWIWRWIVLVIDYSGNLEVFWRSWRWFGTRIVISEGDWKLSYSFCLCCNVL